MCIYVKLRNNICYTLCELMCIILDEKHKHCKQHIPAVDCLILSCCKNLSTSFTALGFCELAHS